MTFYRSFFILASRGLTKNLLKVESYAVLNMPIQEKTPLPPKTTQDKGKNKEKTDNNKPAASGFSQFWAELSEASLDEEKRLEKFLAFLAPIKKPFIPLIDYISPIFKQNKKLLWPLFLLLIMVLLPWISQASISSQTEAELKAYAQPMDPIKTGQLAMNLNEYMPPQLYADPDQVVLNEMTESENYTLAQQLSINAGSDPQEAPERQAPTYTLQGGETITQVAARFDLHVGTILQANNIKAEDLKKIKPGTVLKIPSSDTDTSDAWLVAINKAEADAKAAAAKAAADAAKKKAQQNRVNTRSGNAIATTAGSYRSGNVTVIGTSYLQCVVWARENSGIGIHGYAGDIAATQSEPRVGGIALDRFFGHASVVVGIGADTITVHEANWIRGKITERTVSKAAIRGYVY